MSKLLKLNQLWLLIKAQFYEIIREPGVIFWGIIFPILMSLGLGLAFTKKKTEVVRKVAVINEQTATIPGDSLPLFSFLERKCEINKAKDSDDYKWKYVIRDDKLGNSVFLFYETGWNDAMVELKRGTVNCILSDDGNMPVFHFDPMNSDAELTYLKLNGVIGKESATESVRNTEIRPLTVTGTRYIDFLVPGLITMGVMMSSMWGISYGLIEKRSKKLLRRLVATPMKKSHFLISLITVRIAMNLIEAATLLIFALIAFDMMVQGSFTALLLMFLAGNIAFSGIAIFVSSHTANTEVGNGLINFVVMPMMVLSGIFFSYHNFPEWSISVIRVLPLTMLTDGIRSIFNEGAGLREVALPLTILTGTGVVFFGAGLKIFKWS